MSTLAPLNVLFAEDDTLFRLMETALLRVATPQGEKALQYFFGPQYAAPLQELLVMADRLGLPRDVETTVAESEAMLDVTMPGCDFLVLERTPLTAARFAVLKPRTKLVQQFGQDTRHIDLAAARAAGITLASLQRYTSLSCADHIVALVLALARNLLPAHRNVIARRDPKLAPAFASDPPRNNFNWAGVSDIRVLADHTLGFIGMGENAALVARRLQAMGMPMLYYKRTRLTLEEETEQGGVTYAPRDELLTRCDFVVINVPYSPVTEKMVDAAFLARMKRGSYLINTSRGGVCDERALYDALRSDHLAGAALDVYRYEPVPPDCPLLDLDNILWTPHMAAGRPEFMLRDSWDVLANVARVLRGERPTGQLSPN